MLRMRKIISLVIAFAIVMVPSISSFAMESSQNYDLKIPSIGEKLEIIPIDQKTINVSLGTEKGTIHIVSDNKEFRKVTVTSPNAAPFTFTYDKANGTVTSSLTGKVVQIDEPNAMAKASPKVGDRKTIKISYKEIKDAVGVAGNIIGVAGFIASFFTGGTAAFVGKIATMLGGFTSLFGLIKKGSPSHGIKITSEYYMRSSTKNGKVYRYGDWKVVSITKY